MSAIKNFFSKKSEQIDGSVAVLVVVGALVISGFNVASAAPSHAPSEQVKTIVTGGSAGTQITTSGGAGGSIFDGDESLFGADK